MRSKWDYLFAGWCAAFIGFVIIEAFGMLGTTTTAKTYGWTEVANFFVFSAAWSVASIQIYKFFKEG